MANKELSIIIPTKNEGAVLQKCLNSIRNLDYPEDKIEVIIVDGHSTDETVEIAERHGCKGQQCMRMLQHEVAHVIQA